ACLELCRRLGVSTILDFRGESCRGVATATASGMMSTRRPAKISSVVRQPNVWMRCTPSGENRNWPNEPDAVPRPNESDRQLSGSNLPNDEIIRLNEHPDRPKPISKPVDGRSSPGVAACAIM